MSYAGLRVSEMTTLRVCDINLAKGCLQVTGKGNKQRLVPIPEKLKEQTEKYLQKYSTRLDYESPVVGGCRSAWHKVVQNTAKRNLGRVDIHCHTLRHSYATALYEKGVTIEKIAEILGHTSIETTLIYSHISMASKHEAVQRLDTTGTKIFSFLKRKKKTELQVQQGGGLIGREKEIHEIRELIVKQKSFILSGVAGCGKSALLQSIPEKLYVKDFARKKTLVYLLLAQSGSVMESTQGGGIDPESGEIPQNGGDDEELKKELNKMKVDELIEALQHKHKTIVIDDISELSKADKKMIHALAQGNIIISASTKLPDRKLFDTYIEIKPLKRHHTRQILAEKIHIVDPTKKENVINDILHSSGENLKEADYIARQMQLGKSSEEIVSPERYQNQVSIAPLLLLVLLFFFSYVIKSYTSSMIAFSYAMIIVFRFVFFRLIISKTLSRRRA